MVTKPEQKDAEVRHVKSALKANGYKEWAFRIPHPKTRPTPLITPQGSRPAPVWAYHISEVQRQDTWSQKVWCHIWNPVSGMPCAVCRWNCPYPGDKDGRPLETAVSTNSCEKPWTPHQNVKMITREDNMWRRKIRESIEIRTHHPAINRD